MLAPAPSSPSSMAGVGGGGGGATDGMGGGGPVVTGTFTSVISTCCSTCSGCRVGGAFWITSTIGVRPATPPPAQLA